MSTAAATDCIWELICQDAENALKAMRGDDAFALSPNVYDLGRIPASRDDESDFSFQDGDTVVFVGPIENEDPDNSRSQLGGELPIRWDMQLNVRIYVAEAEGSRHSIRSRMLNGAADVIRKLKQDNTRGGYCRHQEVLRVQPFYMIREQFPSVLVTLGLSLSTHASNPYSQGV